MQIKPISDVTCALLHDRFAPVDGLQLLDFIGLAAARAGYASRAEMGPDATDKDIDVRFGDVGITVRQNAQRLPTETLTATLDYPGTHLMLPEAKTIAERHVASTVVSVSKIAGPSGENEPSLGVGGFDQWRHARRAMSLCLWVSDYLARKNRASAVHWRPSDHLVGQSVLNEAAQSEAPHAPYLLYVRPHLLRGDDVSRDSGAVGVEAVGAEHLIGMPVAIEPARAPHGWMVEQAIGFIAGCHDRGTLPSDGELVGESDAEQVRVNYQAPSDEVPGGSIRLVVVRSERHGIGTAAASQALNDATRALVGTAGANLNPDDEIDKAILELLAERQRRSTVDDGQALEVVDDPVAGPASSGPVPFRSNAGGETDALREQEAPKTGLGLAELRRIANTGEARQPSKRRWLGRKPVDPPEQSQPEAPAKSMEIEPPRMEPVELEQEPAKHTERGRDAPGAEPVAFDPAGRPLKHPQVPDAEPVAMELVADPAEQAGLLRGILARLRGRAARKAA